MKPLIDFKLQPTLSADDNSRCYLMKDLDISSAVVGCCLETVYKGKRLIFEIEHTHIECTLLDDNNNYVCIFRIEDEDGVTIDDAKLLQTLLILLKDEIQAYADEQKAKCGWEKQDTIHVTI